MTSKQAPKHFVQVKDGRQKQGSKFNDPIVVDDGKIQDENAQGGTPKQAAINSATKGVCINQENRFQALTIEVEVDPVKVAMREEDRQLA